MIRPIRPKNLVIALFVFVFVGAVASPLAEAQIGPTYSLDYQGPPIGALSAGICIKEGDILRPTTPLFLPAPGPLPLPTIYQQGGPRGALPDLGVGTDVAVACHPAGAALPFGMYVEIDALSYGDDYPINTAETFPILFSFSVDEFAIGFAGPIAPPSVMTEGAAGADEASADVFVTTVPTGLLPAPPFATPPINTQLFDGNGVAPPVAVLVPFPFAGPAGLGLAEPNAPGPLLPDPGANLDALDVDTLDPFGPAVVFPVYFSLDAMYPDPFDGPAASPPNTGSAGANGFLPGAVLVSFGGPPAVFAPSVALGLDLAGPPGDDLDALILWENGTGVFEAPLGPFSWVGGATDMIFFSVRRGSAVIGLPDSCFGIPIVEGDILTVPMPPFFSPFPCLWLAAENLGLNPGPIRGGPMAAGDDVDALDVSADCNANLMPDRLDIAYGLSVDANSNLVPDECECAAIPLAPTPTGGACAVTADCNPAGTGATEGVCIAGLCHTPYNRYLEFIPPPIPAGATAMAFRVILDTLPGPLDCLQMPDYSAFTGMVKWVSAQNAEGESTLVDFPVYMTDWGRCSVNGAECDVDADCVVPQTCSISRVTVTDCEVVPCATYDVQAISDGAGCGIMDPAAFSPSLMLETANRPGNVSGFSATVLSPADGGSATSFVDIGWLLSRFTGSPAIPMNQRPRVDLSGNVPTQGSGPIPPAANNIDFIDVGHAVSGFQGIGYAVIIGGPGGAGPNGPGSCGP